MEALPSEASSSRREVGVIVVGTAVASPRNTPRVGCRLYKLGCSRTCCDYTVSSPEIHETGIERGEWGRSK